MKTHPSSDKDLETMGEAYRELLEGALRKARQGGSSLFHWLGGHGHDDPQHDIDQKGHEVAELERYVRRDLADSARYRHETGRDLHDWLGFDVALIEQAFWNIFSDAADQTLLAVHEMRLQAEVSEYHTGEMVGLGTLACDKCNERLHFSAVARIPPCPRCGGTHFHRAVDGPPLA